MLRRLLTLLAIITGLTAIGAPAQARFSGLEDVQVQVAGESAARCQAQQLASLEQPLEHLLKCTADAPFRPRPIVTIMVPTVRLQADRAHE
jgi:hypothetical protein